MAPVFCATVLALIGAPSRPAAATNLVVETRGGITASAQIVAGFRLQIEVPPDDARGARAFNQSAIKQDDTIARQGPDPAFPYFTVRFALPIPPENAASNVASLTGIDPAVFTHNHSAGFAILPNGDALAIWFSTPPGESESAPTTTFIQARLRYGAEEWDMPELFMDFKNLNDQSALLWRDGKKLWFFGGGRGLSPWVPFKLAMSTDNGATWALSLPRLDRAAADFTAQPITSAFRSPDGSIYFAMDGAKATSFLWRGTADGDRWHDMGGRTGGRHSAVVPLDDHGRLLSIGGKNSSVNGWSPENISTNWGASWSESRPSPFPPLGGGQRPSLIRLANGHLFFVSDACLLKAGKAPPDGWKFGSDCFVAISNDEGASWRIKPLPVRLPNHESGTHGTVGYVVARQAPNGVIHILTSETQPCLHYELNEAWVFSDAGDIAPESSGGVIRDFSEKYPNGRVRSQWRARICPNGRYLLDGLETDFYENGAKEHEASYASGRKRGTETFWNPAGVKLWTWNHDPERNRSGWTQYWPNGTIKSQSSWATFPQARDLGRNYYGRVADGPACQWDEKGKPVRAVMFTNGIYAGALGLSGGASGAP